MFKFSVIHKQIYKINGDSVTQTFYVPETAALVAVDWDTQDAFGIAFWYTFMAPDTYPDDLGDMRKWCFALRGTGHPHDPGMAHVATLVKDGYAWHLMDLEGSHSRWVTRR